MLFWSKSTLHLELSAEEDMAAVRSIADFSFRPCTPFEKLLWSKSFQIYGESEYSLRFVNGTNKKRKKEKGHFKFFLTRARSSHPNSISRRALESAWSN